MQSETTPGDASAEPAAPRRAPSAWVWIPTLYFAQGVPCFVVMSLAGDMFKLLGVSNDMMAKATGLLYLPWVIKPLWSPLVEATGSTRRWTVAMQGVVALGLGIVTCSLWSADYFVPVMVGLWLLAFASATHDIAADAFYLQALPHADQSFFVGVRSTFFRLAMFFVTAGLLALAGLLGDYLPAQQAWSWTFAVGAGLFVWFTIYHQWALPRPEPPAAADDSPALTRVGRMITSFFAKPGVGMGVAYLLLYRVGEAQLAKLAKPFLFDSVESGGLALSEETVAFLYGAIGLGLLTAGGILGGVVASRRGLRRVMIPMALAMNLPNACYVLLSCGQPYLLDPAAGDVSSLGSLALVGTAIGLEQFGYGFGFTAYMIYMMRLAEGPNATTHYALCTGLMALGMMVPSTFAGAVESLLGYPGFFTWVLALSVPSVIMAAIIRRRLPVGD